jgi:hypothetical protein
MRAALTKAKTLGGVLPLCAWCKKVRDDLGLWQDIDTYMALHSEVIFSHGVCPECRTKMFPTTHPNASNS